MSAADSFAEEIASAVPQKGSADGVFYSPKELERMARREYQDPPLKKTSGANPRWYIRVRKRVLVAGKGFRRKQVRVYLGDCNEVKIRDANRLRAEALQQINGQIYAVQSDIPFGDFVQRTYNEKHLPTLGAGTAAKYRLHLTNHILPEFGRWKMSAVGTEEIQDFLNRKDAAGLSWWTRNDLRNILSSVFTKATDWGYWKLKNPTLGVDLGSPKAKRQKRILTDEQVLALLAELPRDVALIVRLADSTGMRVSEILGLKWKNVDLVLGWVVVQERYYRGDEAQPKTQTSIRELPLGHLADEIRKLAGTSPDPETHVFINPRTGEPYDDRNLNQHFLRKVAKRLGFYFQGFGWHSFRRGQITGFQEIGASTIEAQKLAGHSRPSVTATYTIIQRQRQQDLVKLRQERFGKDKKTA